MKWKNPMKQILNKKCRGFEMKKKLVTYNLTCYVLQY